jgi:hypothetical protein
MQGGTARDPASSAIQQSMKKTRSRSAEGRVRHTTHTRSHWLPPIPASNAQRRRGYHGALVRYAPAGRGPAVLCGHSMFRAGSLPLTFSASPRFPPLRPRIHARAPAAPRSPRRAVSSDGLTSAPPRTVAAGLSFSVKRTNGFSRPSSPRHPRCLHSTSRAESLPFITTGLLAVFKVSSKPPC